MGDARRVIAVVVSDAGPAAWLAEAFPGLEADARWFAAGAAADALRRRGFSPASAFEAAPAIESGGFAGVLTGTILGPGPEKESVKAAARMGVPSAAVIEHWSNYRARFLDGDALVLPGRILVCDERARAAAVADGIPPERLAVAGNPVIERTAAASKPAADPRAWRLSVGLDPERRAVVFVSEDYRKHFPEGHPGWHGFDEYRVLDDLSASLGDAQLLVKTHPAEAPGKYGARFRAASVLDVPALLQNADKLVGMGSMLLLEAAARRGDVLAYRPSPRRSFIGVEAGAVRLVETKAALAAALADRSPAPPSAWAASFAGSHERARRAILEAFS